MHDHISKELKLLATKDIVASYAKHQGNVSADDLCQLFKKIYNTIDETLPAEEGRKVGLGL